MSLLMGEMTMTENSKNTEEVSEEVTPEMMEIIDSGDDPENVHEVEEIDYDDLD